jgi:hypothetical protein
MASLEPSSASPNLEPRTSNIKKGETFRSHLFQKFLFSYLFDSIYSFSSSMDDSKVNASFTLK